MKLFTLLLLLCLWCGTSVAETIKIGVVTDLTSFGAFWGNQTRRGAMLAEADAKASGNDVQVVLGDSGFKPTTGVSEVQKMLQVDRVSSFYVEFTPIVVAVSPIIYRNNRLLIGSSTSTDILKSNPYAFKAYLDYEQGCKMLADNWKEKRKVRILAVNLEIGERCIRGASTVLPGLQVERFNGGDDLRSIVTRIRASDTDGLIFAGYEPDARTLLKLMAEMRLQIDLAGTHGDLPTIEPPQEYLSILKNTTVFGFKSVSPQFLKRFQKEFPDAPSLGIEAAAMSYLHVQQLAKAMSKCGKKDISCQVSDLNDQPADLAISFTGWEKRAAKYEMRLKRYDGLKFADLAAR